MTYDYIITGGGIIGLSVGVALVRKHPNCRLLVVEKEKGLAQHQTGHNSGVIHSGIYYKPGSLKAKYAVEGARVMVEFCREHGIAHEVCGKVIVASHEHELPLLENLYQRGTQNGLKLTRLTSEQLREIEPHCAGLAALRVDTTGIADFKGVARKYAELIRQADGEVRTGIRVLGLRQESSCVIVNTTA